MGDPASLTLDGQIATQAHVTVPGVIQGAKYRAFLAENVPAGVG